MSAPDELPPTEPNRSRSKYRVPLLWASFGFLLLAISDAISWPTVDFGLGRYRVAEALSTLGWASLAVGAFLGATSTT